MKAKVRIGLELERMRRNNLKKLHPLRQLFWESTLRCNVACLHCGSDCLSSVTTPDMPKEDFLKVIDEEILPHVNPNEVMIIISGGEPTMRRDLEEVGAALLKRGFPWGMVTNGVAMTEERFCALRKAGLMSLTVSCDGDETDHNWMRGSRFAFEGSRRAIQLAAAESAAYVKELEAQKKAQEVTNRTSTEVVQGRGESRMLPFIWDVVTCVNQHNRTKLPAIREMLWSWGVRDWRVFGIDPMGRAATNPELQLSDSEYREVLDFIRAERHAGRHVSYACEGFLGDYEAEVRDHLYQCAAGLNIASILIDGSISACTSIRGKYYQGNIYRDHFWDVWENGFQPYRDRSWMRHKEPCNDCRMWRYCEGNGMHLRREDGSLMICHWQKCKPV